MGDDEAFLRTIHASPNDSLPRLVYADWLDERGDPRGEYLRLDYQLTAYLTDSNEGLLIRRKMVELRPHLPTAWLAALGDYKSTRTEPDLERIELAAASLEREAVYIDAEKYERRITAAATHPLTGSVAYVECRSQQRRQSLDINYYLRTRDRAGRETSCEIETYNPYFGCDVQFLKWFADAAVVIYREKHRTYICRFGLAAPAEFKDIGDDWVLDGKQLGHWEYRETAVRRLSIPALVELPSMTEDEAASWGLLPAKFW